MENNRIAERAYGGREGESGKWLDGKGRLIDRTKRSLDEGKCLTRGMSLTHWPDDTSLLYGDFTVVPTTPSCGTEALRH